MIIYHYSSNYKYEAIIFAKNRKEADKVYNKDIADYGEDDSMICKEYSFQDFYSNNPLNLPPEQMKIIKEDIIYFRQNGLPFVSLVDSSLV